MAARDYTSLVQAQWDAGRFLCVGLDTDLERLPRSVRALGVREALVHFNRQIIDATKDLVCAFKPNTAFYEAHGDLGWNALRETIQYIREQAPEVPVILDAKRGDIGSTNAGYVQAAFGNLQADAITVQPYLGSEAMQPFLDQKEKGIVILCRTSNTGAGELQDLVVEGEALYLRIAKLVSREWNTNGNCSLVVGATYPAELREVRAVVGDMPILIPGIGAQNGDLVKTVQAGKDSRGQGMIVSASRAVIYASTGDDFAQAARRSAQALNDALRAAL